MTDDPPDWAVQVLERLARVETDVSWVKSWMRRDLFVQAIVATAVAVLVLLLKLGGVI